MYLFVVKLLQPYLLLMVLSWVVLANLWYRRRESRRRLLLLALPLFVLTLMSMPSTAHVAMGTLEWRYEPPPQLPDDAQALVVLGGGVLLPDRTRPKVELAFDSLYRCLHAYDLYRQNRPGLTLVSGGVANYDTSGPTVAATMADFLRTLGVDPNDLLVENESRSTFENAVESRKLLEQRGIHKIILVTEANHMLRSELCFRKQGLEVVPSACAFRAAEFEPSLFAFLPNPQAAADCQQVFHEWLGIVWYWLHGRI